MPCRTRPPNRAHARRAASLVCLAVVVATASASPYPRDGLRDLVHQSSLVIVAEPVELPRARGQAGRFRVLEVLLGTDVRPGETITATRLLRWSREGENRWHTKPAPIARVLLFLKELREDADARSFELVISGVRCLTESGACLAPIQPMSPGSAYFWPAKDLKWPSLLATVREDVKGVREVERLLAIEEATPRNEALFAWIDEHREELHTRAHPGWGTLAYKVFYRVMDSCRPKDCWRAVRLWADLRPSNHLLGAARPAFGSPEGRRLLLGVALDRERTARERAIALQHLGRVDSLWPRPWLEHPAVRRLDKQEQAVLLDDTVPLLTAPDTDLHLPALEAIHRISDPRDKDMKTRRALPALVPLYRTVEPGRFRNRLVAAIRTIGGAEQWQALSGNPYGLVVELRCIRQTVGELALGFNVEHTSAVIYERPTLILERLDESGRKPEEQRSMPLPETRTPHRWHKGYKRSHQSLRIPVDAKPLAPGRWRLTVTGTVGKDRRPWRSEPLEVVVPTRDD